MIFLLHDHTVTTADELEQCHAPAITIRRKHKISLHDGCIGTGGSGGPVVLPEHASITRRETDKTFGEKDDILPDARGFGYHGSRITCEFVAGHERFPDD